jgi:putative RecB family exonuclease
VNAYRKRHSVSAIKLFHDCPQAYNYRYVERVKVDQTEIGEPLRIGTAVHAGLEQAALDIKLEGWQLDDPQLIANAETKLVEEWEFLKLPTHDGRLEDAKGWIREAIAAWDQDGKVVAVEWQIKQDLPSGSGFIGYADRIDRLNENTVEIRDYKNTAKVTNPDDLENDLQVNMYAHFARETWPWANNVVASHQHPNHGGKTIKVKLTDDTISEAVDRFEATVEMINEETDWPARKSMRCNWCDYRDICPLWSKNLDDPDAAAIQDVIDNY